MSGLRRISDIRRLIVSRQAEAFFQASPEKLTIVDGSFQARAILSLVILGIFRVLLFVGQLVLSIRYWDIIWLVDVCVIAMAAKEGWRWFVHRVYEIRRGEITVRTRVWRFCRTRSLQCTAADVVTSVSVGPEPDSACKWIAIRQGRRKMRLSLMPVNRVNFDEIRSLIETYIAGRVVDA